MTNKDLTMDSYPYVTGMGFRNRSDMIFDEFTQDSPDSITRDNQVVFIKIDFAHHFFKYIFPNIKYKIKIITHNGSIGINENYKPYLDNDKLIRWYGQNANFKHKKLESIPLGIANRRWNHGNINIIEKVLESKTKKKNLLYLNFDVNTNFNERNKTFSIFKDKNYVHVENKRPFEDYLIDLKNSKYTLSPEGSGSDCHRIWESILMNSIPIIKKCHNIMFYKDHLPILVVDDWSQINQEFLENKYDEIKKNTNKNMLYMDFWIPRIGLNNKKI